MRRTSGPGRLLDHTASLSGASPQLQDADHLWLSSEGGAETRAASPSPSTPTPCSLSPSPSFPIPLYYRQHLQPFYAGRSQSCRERCSLVTCAQPAAAAAAAGHAGPAKMVKRKSLDENEPECGKGIPFPIQTFLWRQTRFGVIH